MPCRATSSVRKAEATLFRETVPALKRLGPSFISVTYGAGGSTRERTHRTVRHAGQMVYKSKYADL